MYEKRFGLSRRPFPTTPDHSLYYPASEHEAVLARLENAIADNEGFMVVTGGPGMGKTLLGANLLERLGPGIVSAFLSNSHYPDRAGLIQALLYDLGLSYEGVREQVLRLRLTDFLLANSQVHKKTVLVIDEAQNLSVDHLEELRLLGNLEAGSRRAVHFILLGQTSFLDVLRQPQVTALRQRAAVRLLLVPFAVDEAMDYLLHHLRLAGGRPERIIDEAALEVLARGTQGVPRLLNQAAHQALLLADVGELDKVDAEAALEALAVLGLEENARSEETLDAEEPLLGKSAKGEHRRWTIDLDEEMQEDAPVRLAAETRRFA